MYRFKSGDLVEVIADGVGRTEGCGEVFSKGAMAIVNNANPYALEITDKGFKIYTNVKNVSLYYPANVTKEDIVDTYYRVFGLEEEILQEFCMMGAGVLNIQNPNVVNQIDEAISENAGKIAYVCFDEGHIGLKLAGNKHDLSQYNYQQIDPFLRYCGFDDGDWEESMGDPEDPLSLCSCLDTRSLLSVTLGFHNNNCPLFGES